MVSIQMILSNDGKERGGLAPEILWSTFEVIAGPGG